MNLANLKALAEKFRGIADNDAAVDQLARDTKGAHPGETETSNLCDRYIAATNGAAVRAISDEVAARTS